MVAGYLNAGTVELRCLDKASAAAKNSNTGVAVWSGTFSEYRPMADAIRWAEARGMDIYQTLNPLSSIADNAPLRAFQRTARDTDIAAIRTILFDFDPVRPVGEAATVEQVAGAALAADRLARFLEAHGWGAPTVGESGNGIHLLYRTSLGISDAKVMTRLYAGLDMRMGTEDVVFDVTVRNPSRIARTLGTINRKAGRRSRVLSLSEAVTPAALVLETADAVAPPKPKRTWVPVEGEQSKRGGWIRNLDAVGLFSSRGLYLREAGIGKHWVICPWEHEHSTTGETDTVVWEGEWPTFHCSHSHCNGRTMRDVIAVLGAEVRHAA